MSFNITYAMHRIQQGMNLAQATPLIGPLIGSPIKATISTVQMIAALVTKIIFGALAMIPRCTFFEKVSSLASHHIEMGCGGLQYSVMNFFSLGVIGHRVEKEIEMIARRSQYLLQIYVIQEEIGCNF